MKSPTSELPQCATVSSCPLPTPTLFHGPLNIGIMDFKCDGLDGQNRSCNDALGKGYDRQSEDNQNCIYETITDCQVVLARGMGRGVYIGLNQMDIQPILTDIRDIDLAVQAVIDGSIKDRPERLH